MPDTMNPWLNLLAYNPPQAQSPLPLRPANQMPLPAPAEEETEYTTPAQYDLYADQNVGTDIFNMLQPDPGQQRAMNSIMAKQNEMAASRQKDIGLLEDRLSGLKEQADPMKWQNWDLTPLMDLSDQIMGSNTASTYTNPNDKRRAEIMMLEKAIRDEKGNLSNDQIDLLKQQASGMGNPYAMAKIFGTERTVQAKLEKDMRDDLNKNVMGKANEDMQVFGKIHQNIEGGRYTDVVGTLGNIVRQVGGEKGALANSDIERALLRDLDTTIGKAQSLFGGDGRISKENLEYLKRIVNNAQNITYKFHQARLRDKRASYDIGGVYSPYLQKSKWGNNLFQQMENQLDRYAPKTNTQSTPPTPKDQSSNSVKDKRAQLKALYGGG